MNYQVKYTYYRYNSGNGDNGTYYSDISFNELDQATELFEKINACIDGTITDEEKQEIQDKYIPYNGYFTKKPELYALEKVRIV